MAIPTGAPKQSDDGSEEADSQFEGQSIPTRRSGNSDWAVQPRTTNPRIPRRVTAGRIPTTPDRPAE